MPDWLPSLNALRAFEATARHLSYRRAADELRVTPAAVKQLVSKLESSLDASLIKRKGRGLELTELGVSGCDDLTAAMQLIEHSVAKLRGRGRETRLFLSVESSFATAWLVPRLEGFRASHPDITVLIDSNQTIVDIEHGHMDVAIRYGVRSQGDLLVHRLFEDEVFPACSPSLTSGSLALRQLGDIPNVPLIHWDISHMPWAVETRKWFAWKNWLRHFGIDHPPTLKGLYFSEYGQAVQAAIAGQGLLLASWPILREPIDAGLLVAPFSERLKTDIGYELVVSHKVATQPEVVAFIGWLLDTIRSESEGTLPVF